MPETRETVTPAMTPNEWRHALSAPPGVIFGFGFGGEDEGVMSRHRLAAMCLYGQPFGFTREDVALLDELVRGLDYEPERGDETAILDVMLRPEQAERLRPLAEKIRALLPPQPPHATRSWWASH